MPLTTNYDQWMKDTHSMVKPRSESLKKIDAAIKMRNEMDTKKALINWINEQNSKKQDWHKSVRNEKGAVKKLYDQLGILGSIGAFKNIGAEMDDQLAKAHMKRELRLAASKMFTGKKLDFKKSFWGITNSKCKDAASKLQNAQKQVVDLKKTLKPYRGVSDGSSIDIDKESVNSDLKEVITKIMGKTLDGYDDLRNKIIDCVLGASVANFVANATPFFGLVSSGAHVVK